MAEVADVCRSPDTRRYRAARAAGMQETHPNRVLQRIAKTRQDRTDQFRTRLGAKAGRRLKTKTAFDSIQWSPLDWMPKGILAATMADAF